MKPLAALTLALATASAVTPVPLPGVDGPVGFDDLRFSAELHRVVIPAGRTGRLYLLDPGRRALEAISGFSDSPAAGTAHGQGTTSADSGRGWLFAVDRTLRALLVVDPAARRIVARAQLRGVPDYVRWVEPTAEIWVTEPREHAVEVFRVAAGAPPVLAPAGRIEVAGGPESLEIDAGRRRAYTNSWAGETIAIDLVARRVAGRWQNGCKGSRGLALDAPRGFVFVGCDEGQVAVLDARGGAVLGRAAVGRGVDVIAYAAGLAHLYVPGGEAADLTVLGVDGGGAPAVLGTVATARDAHCVTADDAGDVYLCDPARGRLLTFRDPYPASR